MSFPQGKGCLFGSGAVELENMLNLGKILNKKVIFIFGIILILCAAGGFFWWQNREIKGSPADYVIKEIEEGKFVENKKAGLTVKAPEDWQAKKIELLKEGSAVIQTSDIEGEKRDGVVVPPLTRGCGIEITITYKMLNFEEIKKEAREIHWMLVPISEEFEEVIINNKKALKNTWEGKAKGPMIAIYIPTGNKVYTFTLAWAPDEKERCIQEFDKFLETVSINPD